MHWTLGANESRHWTIFRIFTKYFHLPWTHSGGVVQIVTNWTNHWHIQYVQPKHDTSTCMCVCFFECVLEERTHEVWLWTSDHGETGSCWKIKQRGSGPVRQWHIPWGLCDVAEVGVQVVHSHEHKCTHTQTHSMSTAADSAHLTHHWLLVSGTRPGASSPLGIHALLLSCE